MNEYNMKVQRSNFPYKRGLPSCDILFLGLRHESFMSIDVIKLLDTGHVYMTCSCIRCIGHHQLLVRTSTSMHSVR